MKINLKKILLAGLLAVFCLSVSTNHVYASEKAKYVFLFIGDGMGKAQRELAEFCSRQIDPNKTKLTMNHLPVKGRMTTHSKNSKVTDSAASATAMATGTKVPNKTLSLSGDKKLKTVAEALKENGFKVGIITDVPLDHATPAGFYAHVKSRYMYYQISEFIPAAGFDFYAGCKFLSDNPKKLKGKISPVENTKKGGYTVVTDLEKLRELEKGKKAVAIIKRGKARLCDFVTEGIRLLDNDKGFFMMAEAGRIDWAGHGNDSEANIRETLELDYAVDAAMKFYGKHPEDTLIVVVADHETGGLTLNYKTQKEGMNFNLAVNAADLLKQGTVSKKIYSEIKPMIEKKEKVDTITAKIKELLPGEKIDEAQLEKIKQACRKGMKDKAKPGKSAGAVTKLCRKIIEKNAGIGWKTGGHTGVPVVVTAIGKGSEAFGKKFDNTDLPKLIAKIMQIDFK